MTAAIAAALALLCGILALAVLLASIVLFSEVLAALLAGDSSDAPAGGRGSAAVLIPAHDEALLITSTLSAIAPQLTQQDRLVVVADNCTDDTAAIAAAAGAEVVIRTDTERRGKGYALDAGIAFLRSAPPSVVLVIDADCHTAEGTVDRLVRAVGVTGRPAQALNLMRAPSDAPATLRLAEFAWLVKNKVRPEGLSRLGLPCQLGGTGMAFPWEVVSAARLATAHLAEDLQLGLELAADGFPPQLCRGGLVTSEFPTSTAGVKTQRTRWEHGHLSVISRNAPRYLLRGLTTGNWRLLAMTLDLCVPPTALLMLLSVLTWICAALVFELSGSTLALGAASLALLLIGIAVFSSWLRYGRERLPFSALLLGVIYALRKIPLYARFLVARQMDWVRSRRD
jgi:cellulose synthase/poly-beta-1,6-N-acetylglucosamine synthase-like glycosyltransferase